MSDPSNPPRRRGRPPLRPNDPSVLLHVRLPASQYDAVQAKARDAGVPVARWVRFALARANRSTPSGQ
jgi:hypothetical protein